MGVLMEDPRQTLLGSTVGLASRRVVSVVAALSVVFTLTGIAVAQEAVHTLTEGGTALGTVQSAGSLDDLRIVVNVGGDAVASTHVWAVIGGGDYRQRTNNGYWVPWSGAVTDLIDNGFAAKDGKIVFKIVDGSISADNQGITFVVGYRSGDVLKFGTLGVVPKSGDGS